MISNEQICLTGLVIVAVVALALQYEAIAGACAGALGTYIVPKFKSEKE